MKKDFSILIADNNPEILDNMAGTLKEAGYNAFSALTVEECLQVLEREKPDIVLLNAQLEDAEGKRLAKIIMSDTIHPEILLIKESFDPTTNQNNTKEIKDLVNGYITGLHNKNEFLARIDAAARNFKVKRELETALSKARSLLSAMQEGVYVHEMVYDQFGKAIDYRIVEANPASEKHLNIKIEDAVGKLASDLFETNEVPFLDIYAEVAETGVATSFEQYFAPMEKYFRISVYSPGKGMFATTFFDITERRQMEQALLNSEEKYKNLVRDMQVGVILQDPHAKIVMSNPKALELLGLSEDQLMGKTSFDPDWNVIHEDGTPFPGDKHPVPQAIAYGHSVHDIVMGVHRPALNDRIWLRVDAELQYDNNGTLYQVVCSFIDISRRKKAEIALKSKNQELAEALSVKDKFFSIIAHDLRSPFVGFLGLSQILANELYSLTMDQIQDISAKISNSAASLFSLLGNLLQWASLQRGLTTLSLDSITFKSILDENLVQISDVAERKEITFNCDIPSDLTLFADVNMISSIVRNLISNALKFTHKNGNITITAKQVSGKMVEISVRDSGIGMNKDLVQDLFDLTINTSRRGIDGEISTGLGLIICKDLIEMHGGRIWVESEENNGSTFSFTIPCKSETTDKATSENTLSSGHCLEPLKKLKVLIVEDDEISCSVLDKNIRKFSSEIIHAVTGPDAVHLCHIHPDIDLVLMDLRLPMMSGQDATREIRRFNKEVIIIAQTAQALSNDKKLAMDEGCNDYISKPIDFILLDKMIRSYFSI